jgi:hypothetical protein
MDKERRQHKRFPLLLDVRFPSLGQYSLQTYDVSLGGCYVESPGELAVGQLVPFEIQLPTGDWMPVYAQVAHHSPYIGLGMRFLGLTERDKDLLTRTIKRGDQG